MQNEIIDSKLIDNVISESIDIANARIEFENGCIANLTTSRISNKEMRKMRLFEKQNHIAIDFLKGTLEEYNVNCNKQKSNSYDKIIELGNKNKKYVLYNKPIINKHNALKKELQHFIDSIKTKTNPITDGYNAVKALKIALEIQSIIEK